MVPTDTVFMYTVKSTEKFEKPIDRAKTDRFQTQNENLKSENVTVPSR